MLASGSPSFRFLPAFIAGGISAVLSAAAGLTGYAQEPDRIRPVTDAELQEPSPDEWLMWRRTLDGWGYSPLDQVNRDNVADLQMVWSRAAFGRAVSRGRRWCATACCSCRTRATSFRR